RLAEVAAYGRAAGRARVMISAKGCMMDGNHQAIWQYDIWWMGLASKVGSGRLSMSTVPIGRYLTTCMRPNMCFPAPAWWSSIWTVRFGSVAMKVEGGATWDIYGRDKK